MPSPKEPPCTHCHVTRGRNYKERPHCLAKRKGEHRVKDVKMPPSSPIPGFSIFSLGNTGQIKFPSLAQHLLFSPKRKEANSNWVLRVLKLAQTLEETVA